MNMQNFETYFPTSLILMTERVLLRKLEDDDAEKLFAVAQEPSLFTWFTRYLNEKEGMDGWIEEAIGHYQQRIRFPFVVTLKDKDTICGSTSLGNISFPDKRVEIGWTWYGDAFRGTGINIHCKFLLMQYAFDTLEFERVELKTDALNLRSRAAMKKLGLVEEGTLRSHMSMPGGRRRDSVYYSVIKSEWPAMRRRLIEML